MLWLHKPQILYQWANGLAYFKVASVVGWVRLVSYVMVHDLERFLTLIGWLDQKTIPVAGSGSALGELPRPVDGGSTSYTIVTHRYVYTP